MRLLSTLAATGLLFFFANRTADSQGFSAPTVDRVGFPADYKTTFTKLLTVDRPDNGQIRVIWGNALAAGTNWWVSYPYGSVLLFESWTSKRNPDNSLIYDENGQRLRIAGIAPPAICRVAPHATGPFGDSPMELAAAGRRLHLRCRNMRSSPAM